MFSQYSNKSKNRFWVPSWKLGLIIFIFFVSICGLIYVNYFFKVRNINIEFFDGQENAEIKNYLDETIRRESNSFWNYIFLDPEFLTKLVRDEYQVVDNVKIAKKINLNLNVKVFKNDEYFYACVDGENNFLVNCMLGNSNGSFFKEVDENYQNEKVIKFKINPKALYDRKTEEKVVEPDSLSGTRIYTEKDFLILKEILKWLFKNGFIVKEVFVNELKIVEIKTEYYILKVSLDKGYVDTIKDFETISKTGKLQKILDDEKENLQYIDLSFKDKVFFKLKNTTKNDMMSTSTHE